MINELEKKYDEFKNIIDVMPVNNKDNRKKKINYLENEKTTTNGILSNVKLEIKDRLSKLDSLVENPDIKKLSSELEKCNILNEWNLYNTAYEKMHLDYYLYQLHRYYREDLTSVNSCIEKILESFSKVGIEIQKEDFEFNIFVASYMERVINKADGEELRTYFEEIYWKFPDIIKTIEISFKSIYLKYEKKINKYYTDRHNDFLKKHNDNEITDMRIKLNKELLELKNRDAYSIFNKFKNKDYTLSVFNETEIKKKRELYFQSDNYSYDNLYKLYRSLIEYNMFLKYNYLLVDMRSRLEKKEELKNAKDKALKEIAKEEAKLKKLNAIKDSKRKVIFKQKSDERWLFNYNSSLNNLISLYNEFDDARFNELIFNCLSKDSNVLDILRFVGSNYLYFVKKTKELDENQTINIINDKYDELKDEVNNYEYSLINNIALLNERQIKEIIVDKYNLENITITLEMLQKDNIEKTITDIKGLLNYEDVIDSGIKLDDIKLFLEAEKIFNN